MPNYKRNVYGLYLNGELVKEGIGRDLCKEFKLKPNNLFDCARRGTKVGEYTVKIIKVIDQREVYNKLKKKEEYDWFDYLYRHLKEYGNTVINDYPGEYLEGLEKKLGGKILVHQKSDVDDPFNYEPELSKPGKFKRGRRKPYYLLEVKYGLPKIQK